MTTYFKPITTSQNDVQDVKVVAGQLTYDAEGNDIPGSTYYSRVIHWPGNDLSGVTLGRGYDMGNRSEREIYAHMSQAGVDAGKAKKISMAFGRKGESARTFVRDNKFLIGEITAAQQVALFNIIYPAYVKRAVLNYNKWTAAENDRLEWEDLDLMIRDVLVDFVYQGFTRGPKPMRSGMRNSKSEMISYIESSPVLSQYEPGRRRANYLRDS